jgi:hypothetical protein
MHQWKEHLLRIEESRFPKAILNYGPRDKEKEVKRETLDKYMKPERTIMPRPWNKEEFFTFIKIYLIQYFAITCKSE